MLPTVPMLSENAHGDKDLPRKVRSSRALAHRNPSRRLSNGLAQTVTWLSSRAMLLRYTRWSFLSDRVVRALHRRDFHRCCLYHGHTFVN